MMCALAIFTAALGGIFVGAVGLYAFIMRECSKLEGGDDA